MNDRVVLYTLSTCPVCKRVGRLLDDHGVAYRTIAVDLLPAETRAARMDELKSVVRPLAFPLLVAGEKAIAGNQPEEIRRVLGLRARGRRGIFRRLFRVPDR